MYGSKKNQRDPWIHRFVILDIEHDSKRKKKLYRKLNIIIFSLNIHFNFLDFIQSFDWMKIRSNRNSIEEKTWSFD